MTRSRSLALLGVALLLAACGGGDSTGSPAATTSETAGPTASTAVVPSESPVPTASAVASPAGGSSGLGVTGPAPQLDLEVVTRGLEDPLDIAFRSGDDALFVLEQEGRVRIVRDGTLVERPFLDIADQVTAGGEQGLLGLTFHPDPTDGRFFVYYTDREQQQVVASFRTDPDDPDRALADSERIILRMEDQFGNHNGGGLAFGPDGYLYVSTGDGGGGGDPLGSGRSLDTLLAKVLRLDIDVAEDADPAYTIPEDNPLVGQDGARPEIWLTGLRNPWRIRFDPPTGDLWIGDVGQGAWEEIDHVPAGESGLDFGWNAMEGTHCFGRNGCDQDGLTLPVAEYGHDEGCSVTGGTIYRGTAQPALGGWYVFADFCSGRVWVLDPAAPSPQEPAVAMDSGRSISAIATGPDGELYATDLSAGDLLRVVVAGS